MSPASGNAATHFVDRHGAEGRGSKIAFREVGTGRSLTYDALRLGAERVAGALTRAGIGREERAAMVVLDGLEFPRIFWGALKAGVLAAPINTLLSSALYDAILRDSRATCLFVSSALWPTLAPAAKDNPHLRCVVAIGDPAPEGTISFEAFLDGATPRGTLDVQEDEPAFWLYSSGSTGQPKGVRHVHGALRATADTFGARVLGIREDDVVFSAAKLFFAYGLGNSMTFPLAVGATTALLAARPTPAVVDAA
ncbi:MAG: AMP-binding protein, partial [Hyphomicrobiales bacterium]|nr:AMP-binding protein [Hyphomicrobiales bacterium]